MTGAQLVDPIPGADAFWFCERKLKAGEGWHIRRGDAQAAALCGLDVKGGFDLRVPIAEIHLARACPKCVEAFRAALAAEKPA